MNKYKLQQLVVVGGIATFFGACKSHNNTVVAPVLVTIQTVSQAPTTYYDEYPATVVALQQVNLLAQVTGYVTDILFKDGTYVYKGQKLYIIDSVTYRARYDQAVGNWNVARAALRKAQSDNKRYQELLATDAISHQVAEHAEADLDAAQMQVAATNAGVQNAKIDLDRSVIYAPFSGIIGISQVRGGALATANQTLLNTISSIDPIAVDIPIAQNEIAHFLQFLVNPVVADSVFRFKVDGVVYPYVGKISTLDRAVDPQTGTVTARFVFANGKNVLRAGMTGNLVVKNNSGAERFTLIPQKAVSEQLGEFFVYTVNDSMKCQQQHVQLGMYIGNQVVVLSGLQEGEKIVVEGTNKVKNGSIVSDAERGSTK